MAKTLKFIYVSILFIFIFLVIIVCDSSYLPNSRPCIIDKVVHKWENILLGVVKPTANIAHWDEGVLALVNVS